MTRKDFEVMADAFRRTVEKAEGIGLEVYRLGYLDGALDVVHDFVKVAKESNPRFDVERFIARVNRGA